MQMAPSTVHTAVILHPTPTRIIRHAVSVLQLTQQTTSAIKKITLKVQAFILPFAQIQHIQIRVVRKHVVGQGRMRSSFLH